MSQQSDIQQESHLECLVKEELEALIHERLQEHRRNELSYKNLSVWSEVSSQPGSQVDSNSHRFSIYADKQLIHLVIETQFDFEKIAEMLSYSFRSSETTQFSQSICRERWYELHRDRAVMSQIKEKKMEHKRIQSIMSMTDPFSLYDFDERLNKLETQERRQERQKAEQNLENQRQDGKIAAHDDTSPIKSELKNKPSSHSGYNIFKDSIRTTHNSNVPEYQESRSFMRQKILEAQQSPSVSEKPMLYTPLYERLSALEFHEEELTTERMQQMMSRPIEMELIEREIASAKKKSKKPSQSGGLQQVDQDEEIVQYQSKIKREALSQVKKTRQQQFDIEDDWDEYESD